MQLPIYDRTGAQVGTYELEPRELAPRINRQLLHDVVVMYQANLRQGTFRTKTRGEVAGTTKKMYRQKGTGNARAGSRRSGIRRGGGHIFAKRPRSFYYRLPRKALQAATRMALAARLLDGEVVIIDELAFSTPKTREMYAILKALGCAEQRLLIAIPQYDPHVYLSARNIDQVSIAPVSDLNAYSVLLPQRLLITREALDVFRARAAAASRDAAAAGAAAEAAV
ncbi:MAG: 50S ribosomal protein L4 [Pirellulales bacterium]|nr:50S ribosomal protein L4 [Pirellulales bacterium]